MKHKGILIVVVLAILVLAGFAYYSSTITNTKEPTIETETIANSTSTVSTDLKPVVTSKDPWVVFQTYLNYAKAHDENGMNSVSHNQSPKCAQTTEQCNAQLDYIYNTLSKINKNEYVNKNEDSKQIIITTNAKKNDTADSKGYVKGIIYFTKDSKGNLKFLSVSPSGGWSHSTVNTNLTEAQIEAELQAMMLDTDKDGLTDQQERCEGASQFLNCNNTDPAKNDTDMDGWWDGIEARFK